MKVPADLYARSPRVYRGLDELTYPFHDHMITVTRCGRICFKRRKVNLRHVFAGQNVGVMQAAERSWLVTTRTDRQPARPESVTYVPGMNCHPCVRNGPWIRGAPGRSRTCDPRIRSRGPVKSRPSVFPRTCA